jgi:hypothetical protein
VMGGRRGTYHCNVQALLAIAEKLASPRDAGDRALAHVEVTSMWWSLGALSRHSQATARGKYRGLSLCCRQAVWCCWCRGVARESFMPMLLVRAST